ncbi:chemotactic signal-response protein CheL [mine drainage metagenome]|uniref:Chemotactic signal-response protein CheL n=1 Tax=mine drainage metagenome TaxID=410659 RepID=A0A1J5RS66_9ZZZZ
MLDQTATSASSAALTAQAGYAATRGLSGAAGIPVGRPGESRAEIRQTAEKFETMFLSQMFSHMFEGIKSDAMFGGGHGEEMFQSMLINEYSQQVSKHGGLGIANAVMRTLIAEQEKGQ